MHRNDRSDSGGKPAPEPASFPSGTRAGRPQRSDPAGAEGSSHSHPRAGQSLPCSSPITPCGERRRLRGFHLGLCRTEAPAAGPPPGGGRERRRTPTDCSSRRSHCAFATERRPDLLSRQAVACRRGRRARRRGGFDSRISPRHRCRQRFQCCTAPGRILDFRFFGLLHGFRNLESKI